MVFLVLLPDLRVNMMHLVQVMDAAVFLLDLVVCKSFSLFDNICFFQHYLDFLHIVFIVIHWSEYVSGFDKLYLFL